LVAQAWRKRPNGNWCSHDTVSTACIISIVDTAAQVRNLRRFRLAQPSLAPAQKTLQRLNDPQAKNALFVLGFALANVKRYAEAIEPLEQSLRDAATIKDSGARNTAMLEYALARSLRGTKRDPARAKQLAQSALRSFRSLKIQDEVRDVAAFLAQP